MCGVTGFWDPKNQYKKKEAEALGHKMALAIESRGPDSSDVWVDEERGIVLAHRRLAIQDLSPHGNQPMHSPSRRFTTIYNGEIYNAPEIQKDLLKRGYKFRGHSDTEVMLAAFEEWGIERSLSKFIGMFAIVLWDHKEKKLFLIRDRLGIKPLYWGWQKGVLFFGSQIKAFRDHPSFKGEISKTALVSFFRFSYVPAPQTIYEGIEKIEPGTIVAVDCDGKSQKSTYWSMQSAYNHSDKNPYEGSLKEAQADLDGLLKDAVQKRMLADVPLGAFLSGGVDSSAVVALMQAQSNRPVKTFSIGFNEAQYNEAQHAKEVAKHLGTDHYELYVTPKEAQDVIPHLSDWYDEPFADSSQIPTYLVSKLARQHVTVSLSGDGGDELFSGYTRYFVGERLWTASAKLPNLLKQGVGGVLNSIPPGFWQGLEKIGPSKLLPKHLAEKALKLSELCNAHSFQDFYKALVSQNSNPAGLVCGGMESTYAVWDHLKGDQTSHIRTMQFLDSVTYLPDDILTKVDRASMAVSLEARVPLLDHRVVEFASALPLSMKVHKGQGKHILREVLYQYVPKNLIERPKMGFGVPIGDWLRKDLNAWAEDLLSPASLEKSGLLEAATIRKLWLEHMSGKKNWQYALWPVLMFQAWYDRYHA